MEEGVKSQPETGPVTGDAGLIDAILAVEEDKSPFGSLGLFLVTLVLFFTTGLVRSDIREIGILVGVLLFHELGHLAAMKLLGYRDVRMFFIPFLGAAVTGKSRSDFAIRSCFVSLMGPLPGVFVGLVFLFLYKLTNEYYLLKTAQIMLFLNVFNMLPIMPLDGGRYVDVMFIRNRGFRFALALFGVACFAALAISGTDIILGIVALLSLFAAFANLKINGVARHMLAQGLAEKDLAALAANPAMFERILDRLRAVFPKSFEPQPNAKAIHGYVTHILDSVRFQPAGWLAKFGLGLVYGVLLLVSLSLAILVLAANYNEKVNLADDNSLVLESYAMGNKAMEIPLDRELRYHGVGRDFGKDTNTVTGIFEYDHGFRVGRRVEFDNSGDTAEIRWYTRGRFDSSQEFLAGRPGKTTKAESDPWFMRSMSWVIWKTQPRVSNHKYFD